MADFDWSWYQNRAYPAQPQAPQPQFDWSRYYSGGFQPQAPSRVDPPGAGPDRGFFADLFGAPTSNIGGPPTTRTVASVPVNIPKGTALSRDSKSQTQLGRDTVTRLGPTAFGPNTLPPPLVTASSGLPGPRAVPKTQDQIPTGFRYPDLEVASELDVAPPTQVYRPITGYPTAASLRPGALPPLPLPRPANSPLQPVAAVPGAPIPPLPIGRMGMVQGPAPTREGVPNTYTGAAGKQAGKQGGPKGGGGSGSSAPQQRFELNGREVRPVQTSRYNASTNKFETVTVYR